MVSPPDSSPPPSDPSSDPSSDPFSDLPIKPRDDLTTRMHTNQRAGPQARLQDRASAKPAVASAKATRAVWSAKSITRFKPVLFLCGLYPLGRWVVLGMTGGLTANPIEFLTRSSGLWALVWLMVTLSITPIRRLLKQAALVRLRRMCGLFAFFYAALHATAWLWWDRALDLALMWRDVIDRPFITVGMAAFILMTALAVTSTQGWMRRLGRHWQRLHRAVYLIGMLAVLHFWWHKAGKNDFTEPGIYAAILAVLLGWRLVTAIAARRQR